MSNQDIIDRINLILLDAGSKEEMVKQLNLLQTELIYYQNDSNQVVLKKLEKYGKVSSEVDIA